VAAIECDINLFLALVGMGCRRLTRFKSYRIYTQFSTSQLLGKLPVKKSRLGERFLTDAVKIDDSIILSHSSWLIERNIKMAAKHRRVDNPYHIVLAITLSASCTLFLSGIATICPLMKR
jgi:hypothetical protein